jgi:hypothetical protein
VLAVASQEGLSGGIGDGGHAYGPFQLNNAGGVITGTHPAVNDQATESWANSPAGIAFALDRIARVSHGLKGRAAINAIVSQFERPANIPREIAGASRAYGNYSLGGGPLSAPPSPAAGGTLPSLPPPQRPGLDAQTLAILNAGNRMFGLPALPALPQPKAVQGSAPVRLPQAGSTSSSPASAPPPVKGPTYKWIEHFAAPFNLTVTATTNGKHAPHSYHYQGRAVDLAGNSQNMAELANYALQHAGEFREMFYTGPGHPNFFISDGKVLPLNQLDHGLYLEHENHVHLAR